MKVEQEEMRNMLGENMRTQDGVAAELNNKSNENKANQRFSKKLLYGKHMEYVSAALMITFAWLLLYTLFEDEVMPPNGGLYSLLLLAFGSLIFGQVVNLVKLPPLLGMLIFGIVLSNLGFFRVHGTYLKIVTRLREISLTMILVKGGLGLEPDVLYKNSMTVAKLSFIPCIVEAFAVGVACNFIMNMPWLWGLSLGFVLAAVSPAVVVGTLLRFKKEGLGEDKGISTMIIAASSLDDIVAISAFGIVVAILFATGDLISSVSRGPLELIIGIGSGVLCGFVIAITTNPAEKYVTPKRIFLVGVSGLTFVLGTPLFGFPGAGPLAAIVTSFTANTLWRRNEYKNSRNPVAKAYSIIWLITEPLLFGLVGTEIKLKHLTMKLFLEGNLVLFLGLIARTIGCCISVLGAGLNMKEIIFVNLAWLPKATVQAALGPVLLDMLNNKKIENTQMKEYATDILTLAVLSILVTAPLGSVGIAITGPKLLNKVVVESRCNERSDNKSKENAYSSIENATTTNDAEYAL